MPVRLTPIGLVSSKPRLWGMETHLSPNCRTRPTTPKNKMTSSKPLGPQQVVKLWDVHATVAQHLPPVTSEYSTAHICMPEPRPSSSQPLPRQQPAGRVGQSQADTKFSQLQQSPHDVGIHQSGAYFTFPFRLHHHGLRTDTMWVG